MEATITVVTLPLPDPEVAAESDMVVEIEIPSDVAFISLVRSVVVAAANSVGAFSGDRLDDLRWVMSEATTNAVEANLALGEKEPIDGQPVPPCRVQIKCDFAGGKVLLEVVDMGPGLGVPPSLPDMTHPDRLKIEGGFGVPLIKQFAEVVTYAADATGTTITIKLD